MKNNCALVVTYNRPTLLIRCISSLINQKLKPNSIILVDNGSDNDTYDALVAKGYLKSDSIKYDSKGVYFQKSIVSQIDINYYKFIENKGPGYAFYFGVRTFQSMNYKWLWMMDDDGFPDYDCLYHLENKKTNADFLNPVVLDELNSEQLAFGIYSRRYNVLIKTKLDAVQYAENGFIHGAANPFNGTYISRNLVSSIGFPLYQMYGWGVEVEYERRAEKFGFKVVTVSEAYHFHPVSRVEHVSILHGLFKLNRQSNKFKNYIDIRNSNYIWYRYYGVRTNIKFFLAYSYFYLKNFMFLEWVNYLGASLDGIFSIWGKEKRYLK